MVTMTQPIAPERVLGDQASAGRLVPPLALAAFVNMTGALALGPFLPVIADELGTSVAVLGQVPASAMLMAAALGLVAGPLAERYGYRRTLVVSMLAVAVSALGMGLAPTLLPLLLAGLLGAVGRSAVLPTAQAVVGARFQDDERRRAVSWLVTGHSGSALAGVPVLASIAVFTSWRVALGVLGLAALAMALLIARTPMAGGGAGGTPLRLRAVLASYARLWRNRPLAIVVLTSFVGGTGIWTAFTYLGAYLSRQHGFTTAEVGWSYLAVGVCIVFGARLAGTRVGARPRLLLVVSRIVGGLSVGGAFLLPLSAVASLGLLVVAATADLAATTAAALLLVSGAPESRATTMTVNGSASSLGVACGGAVGGLVLAFADYWALGVVGMTCLLTAAVLLWCSRPRSVGGVSASAAS